MHQLALQRAEEGDWAELADLAENLPHSIMVADEFGMLPLHWAVTEPAVPLGILELLIKVFPEACETKNLSGMLPLHVAISNKLPALHLNVLVQACPDAVFVKSGDGYFPAGLARKHRLPEHSVNVLKKSVSLPDRRASLGARMSSIGSSLNRRGSILSLPRSESVETNLKSYARSRRSPSQASTMSSHSAFDSQRTMPSYVGSSASLASLDAHESDDAIDDISSDLRDLTGQLAQLGAALRSAPAASPTHSGDESDIGARIKRFTGGSEALGVDALRTGDVLVAVNGISVATVPFGTICKFLKKTNVTCKLTFLRPETPTADDEHDLHYVSTSSTGSDLETLPPAYSKMASMLEETMVKVQSVEDLLRLSSVMAV
ncbi:hypothetical protein SPRG_03446 [Saprolegnia parasitica CBS 223.65]|uniref:PDZ domain-containing protein n=1 Tax=Saprolegnia parasitica (strain CBS 223.65) TaxID=695850 RepID=A0A067CQJ2_SAPPC|nr:hypothetical protein SPRG_03446 [Saprolegnia parasitica CBS 223.65]KDO31520.1 hypothetical protein SPRG_03446 [Saprolegnia parasitica CBS 223.65]|eukprot:XP_012197430.1 hypothetical protein SPRG_03446 [Saprolegnia parasitica CBS 223.65]